MAGLWDKVNAAAADDDMFTLRRMIERDPDKVHDADRWLGRTPLHYATQQGSMRAVQYLYDKGATVHVVYAHGDTPLHLALNRGHEAACRFLLEEGADVHARNRMGSTPLHEAVCMRYVHLARLLLAKGASRDALDDRGQSPWMMARRQHDDAMMQLLSQ